MAYRVPIANINHEQRKLIQKLLIYTPKRDYNDDYDNRNLEPIHFYRTDTNNTLLLPYMMASSLFQIIPNLNMNFKLINCQFKSNLYPNQIAVFNEAQQQLEEYGTTTLNLYPGFGKTIVGAAHVTKLGYLTCVLMTLTKLTVQWLDTFTKYTTAKCWIVGEGKLPKNLNDIDVIICMKERWSKIPAEWRAQVGTLIIDEAHLFCTHCSVACLLAFQPKYIIAETATLERDDELHLMIYAICGDHGVFKETDKKFHVKKILTNISVPRKLNKKQKTDYTKLTRDTLMHQRRNDIICNLVKHHSQYKILILTSLVDHVQLLYNRLKQTEDVDYLCGNKEKYKDSRVLIGTTHKIGTGFDQASNSAYQGVRFNLLILVFSIQKYQMLVQNVGRVLRADEPIVYHFVDADGIFNNHWLKCQRWYKKRGAELSICNILTPTIEMDKNILNL